MTRLVMRDVGRMLAWGIGLGTAGAFMAAGVTRSMLFGLSPTDPTVFPRRGIDSGVCRARCGVGAGSPSGANRSRHRAAPRVARLWDPDPDLIRIRSRNC